MYKTQILEHLMSITHQPFLVFANAVEEKTDNAFETLKILAKEDNVTAGRISEILDIKPSSVTQIIKKLEEAGTATREKSAEDSRVTVVKITEKGQESLDEHGEIGTTLKEVLFDSFTEDELENLNNYLERMIDNINSEAFELSFKEVFGDDKRWERFGKMSPQFGRAREQMMERGRHGGFDPRRGGMHFNGKHPHGGFEGFQKGRR